MMESDEGEKRNDVLSQSYVQGVERVAQQNNIDAGFGFDLPKEVLEQREKAWGSFFEKYADEVSDEIELNINTLEPIVDEENNDEEDEERVKEENDEGEYYSKCRAPIRKLPALIQYWIDTGNPPYQIIGDDDRSETGSSLSEGEHSRSGQSAVIRETSDMPKFDENSPYSSVDTAVYILSNANITKKSLTMAIVEGAKGANEAFASDIVAFSDIPDQKTPEMTKKEILSIDRDEKSMVIQTFESKALPITTTPLKKSSLLEASLPPEVDEKLNDSSSSRRADIKLSEVLPTFQQLENNMKDSKPIEEPRSRSALSKIRRQSEISDDHQISPSNLPMNSLNNGQTSFFKRRKLYTGRNSPVDLIFPRNNTDNIGAQTLQSSHPAFDASPRIKNSTFASRKRRKRKRKSRQNASRMSEFHRDRDSSQDSNEKTRDFLENDEMRYTDFFESLGLTPSKTRVEKIPPGRSAKKRMKKSDVRARNSERITRNNAKLCESTESSIKDTQDTSQTSNDPILTTKIVADDESGNNPISKMIPLVQIARLSEDILSQYQRRKTVNGKLSPRKIHKKQNISLPIANIELLTTTTQDSDSSTILICSCNNVNQCSDSESSLFTKNFRLSKNRESLRNKEISRLAELEKIDGQSTTREIRKSSRIIASSRNFPSSGEKLSDTDQTINRDISKNPGEASNCVNDKDNVEILEKDDDERLKSQNLVVILEKLVSPKFLRSKKDDFRRKMAETKKKRSLPSPRRIVLSKDSFRANSTEDARCITIGSRIFGESTEGTEKTEKLQKISRSLLPCTLEMLSLDEEENNFVKLLQDVGSKENDEKKYKSKNSLTEKSFDGKEKIENVLFEDSNENEEISKLEKSRRPITRSLNILGIVLSSDEDNDDFIKLTKDSKGRRRKIHENQIVCVDLKNDKQMIDELIENLTNGDGKVEEMENRPENEKTMDERKFDDSDGRNGLRRSPRKKSSPVCENKITVSTDEKEKLASKEENHKRNIFNNGKDGSEFPKSSKTIFESDESKRQTIISSDDLVNVQRKTERTSRFQTRLDSDSESEIPNSKLTATNDATDESGIKNGFKSPKRVLRRKIERNMSEREKNVPENPEVSSSQLESNKKLAPSSEAKSNLRSSVKVNARETRASRRNFPILDDEGEKSSKKLQDKLNIEDQRINGEGKSSVGRKRSRRTKIFGTPMDYESDDDDEFARITINSSSTKELQKTNGKRTKLQNGRSKDQNGRAENLFSNFPDNDVDYFFGTNENSRVTRRSAGLLENLKLIEAKNSKNLMNARKSTIKFRTRLNADSDDDL